MRVSGPRARATMCVLATASLLIPAVSQAAKPPETAARIDAIIRSQFPADRPGAAIIAVKNGQVIFRKAYGLANLELGVPLQPDMVFRLGSVTKQFTATAIMMLAEQGKLSIQDPITKYLPDYPMQGHVITVEHLLTHTSGIQSYTDMPGWMTSKILADMTVQELIDGFKREPMQFAPGERFAYNNSGYILLGAIIEKASGEDYGRFITDHIFKPLGMNSSYYGTNERIIPRRVEGYDGSQAEQRNARYLSMTQPYAAGSLVSTVDDLARWDEALYTERLLKKPALEQMWTPYKLKDGKPTDYGYGWTLAKLQGRRAVEHGGGIFGFTSYGLRLPDDHVYVAVLCNTTTPKADPGFLARKIAAVLVGKPFPEPVAIQLSPEILEKYTGVYQIDKDTQRTVTVESGKMYTMRTGGERLEAKPQSETEFFYENTFTHGTFVMDENGKVTGMLIYQDGAEVPEHAPRVAGKPAERQVVTVDPAIYDAYAGEYELAPGFILTITHEGDKLMTQATGQEKVEMFPSSQTEFFLKVVDAQITFVRGPGGTVDQIVLHQGGRDMPAKKRK